MAKMNSNKPLKQRLILDRTKENRLKILNSISDKPKTFREICDYFDYIDKKNMDIRNKENYINQNIILLKNSYKIIELKPTEQNKNFLRDVFKIEWVTFSGGKIKHNRSPSYYIASPSCHTFFSFYKTIKDRFNKEINRINNEKELEKRFNEAMEFFRILQLIRYNYYLKVKNNKILSQMNLIKNLRIGYLEDNLERTIPYFNDFLLSLLNDKYMQMAFYKNLLLDKSEKKPFIPLFKDNKKSLSTAFLEKVYLLFQEMEKVTDRENIFRD